MTRLFRAVLAATLVLGAAPAARAATPPAGERTAGQNVVDIRLRPGNFRRQRNERQPKTNHRARYRAHPSYILTR